MSELENLEDLWSLQNHEHVGFVGSVVGGAYLLIAVPAWLWRLYVEYLWKWDGHPWIVSAAASLKLLAVLIIAPFALLTLLDVGAYVIARTLGVVETTKASTSDSKDPRGVYSDSDTSETEMTHVASPPVRIDIEHAPGAPDAKRNAAFSPETETSATPSPSSGSTSPTTFRPKPRFDLDNLAIPIPRTPYSHFTRGEQGSAEAEACFFSPSDERQLELSGALLSSPAPSRQASPKLERRHRAQSLTMTVDQLQAHGGPNTSSAVSSAADSDSFTFLEHPEDPEVSDSALGTMMNLRKRGSGRRDDGAATS